MSDPTIIEAQNVTFAYDGKEVLKNISFKIKEGDFLAIIGPNGAGKSTLLNILNASLKPRSGEVLLSNKPVFSFPRIDVARKIAIVPQFSEIVFPYRVIELVMMARHPYVAPFGFESSNDIEIVFEAMADADVSKFADKYFQELSGGEKQGVIIARALAQRTPVLLLDEPTSSLDLKHQIFIYNLLSRLCTKEKRTIVVVSHDINLASLFCDQMILLKNGEIVKTGTAREVIQKELIEEVYETPVDILTDEDGATFLRLKKEKE